LPAAEGRGAREASAEREVEDCLLSEARMDAGSGLLVAASARVATAEAVAELRAAIAPEAVQHLLVFFSVAHDAEALAAALASAFPGVPVSGCSTAGEIGPGGMMTGGVVAVGFPHHGFRVYTDLIADVERFGIGRANDIVRKLKSRIRAAGDDRPLRDRVFALMLVDGLCNREEMLVAAVNWAIDDIQLVGGSAGDGLAFQRTALIHDGAVVTRAALLVMVETSVPFRVFKTQNFEPTPIKLVVTAADTENRIVHELNAEVAAHEYAAAIGLLPDDLGPFSFASYPLVVKVGGEYYCRSIRNMNPDGSLSFFCAIDEGLVFTVARPQDILSSTAQKLTEIDGALGGIDRVLGFDCILRRLDAENRQIRRELDGLYRRFGLVGFHTYGEQYNAMHLNQTLTGIAFGRGDAS
jgi:hypothetical protein